MAAERRTPNRPHLKARKGPAAARRPKRLIRKPKVAQILIIVPQLVPPPPRRAPKRTASDVSLQRTLEGKRHKGDGVRRAPHLDRLEEYARAMAHQCTTGPRDSAPHRPTRPYSRSKETCEGRRFKRKAEKLRRNDIQRRELCIRAWAATAYSGPMVLDNDVICVTIPATSPDSDVQMGFLESEQSFKSDIMEARVGGVAAPTEATQASLLFCLRYFVTLTGNYQGHTVITSSPWSNNRPPTEEGSSTRRANVVLEDIQMSEILVPAVAAEKATPSVPATLNPSVTKRSQGGAMAMGATYTTPTAAAASATSRNRPSPLRTSTTKATSTTEVCDTQQEQKSVKGAIAAPVQETVPPAISTPRFSQEPSTTSALAAGSVVNKAVPSSTPNAPLVLPGKPSAAPRKANGLLRTALDAATRLKLSSAWAMSNAAASSSGSSPVAVPAPVHMPQQGPAFTRPIGGLPASSVGLADRKGKGKATASQSTTATEPMTEAEFQAALEGFAESPSTTSEVPAPQVLIGATPFPTQVQGIATGSQQQLQKVALTVPATAAAADVRPIRTSTGVPSPAPAQSVDVSARKTRRLPRSAMSRLASTVPFAASSTPTSTGATQPSYGPSASTPVPALVDTPHQCGTSTEASGSSISGYPSSAQIGNAAGSAGSSTIVDRAPTPSTERTDHKGKGKASDHRKHLAEWGLDVDEEEEKAQNDRRAFHAAFRNAKGAGGGFVRSRR